MKKLVLTMLTVCCLMGVGFADVTKTQTATINVDGDPSDWSMLTPTLIDREDDSSCLANADIKTIYTAIDSQYAYVMVETYGEPIHPEAILEINFDYKPGESACDGANGDLHTNFSSMDISAWTDIDCSNLEPFPIEGCKVARGSVFEAKIPLSQLEGAEYFNAVFVNIWDYDIIPDGDTHGCDVSSPNDQQPPPDTDEPKYTIEFWQVMKRKYEEGNLEVSRIGFGITDMEGNYLQENPFVSVKVLDPDGTEMTSGDHNFGAYIFINGDYDADAGNWSYDEDFGSANYYGINYSAPLKQGEYRIVAEDADGASYESTKEFSGKIVEQPMISADTFTAYRDEDGDFHMKWEIPEGIVRSVETSVRSWISVYRDEKYIAEINAKSPTDLGVMFIPGNVLEKIIPLGNAFTIGVHLRADDGTFRTYSKEAILDENFSYTGQAAGGNTPSDPAEPLVNTLSSMELSPEEILLTRPGAVQRLLVKGLLTSGAPVTPDDIEWSTSAPDIAVMDGDRVVAVSEGEAVVTAASGTVIAQARVRVSYLPVALDVSSPLVLLEQGQVYTPRVFAVYPDGRREEPADFTLSFKDNAAAGSQVLLIKERSLTGLSPGNARIEATYNELSEEFLVNVNASVPLSVSPSRFRVNPGTVLRVSIDGGTPPYAAATGSVSGNQWTLPAPSLGGTHLYTVTDSKGQTAQLTLTVLIPLDILSEGGVGVSALTLDVGACVSFTPSGGTPPYRWFATAGNLTEQNRGVTFTPPSLSGIHTVTLTDSGGQTRNVIVSTVKALITTPQRLYLSPEETRTIEILGGLAPYTAVADAGTVTQPLGGIAAYTAPGVAGDYLVKIIDARGRISRVQVSVSLPLIVSPLQAFLRRNETRIFRLGGGIGNDGDIFINALKGDVDPHPNGGSFTYTAPGVTGSDTLMVTDAGGDQVKVSVEITSDSFFVTPLQATLLREERRTFRVVGGTGEEITWTAEQGDIAGQKQPSTDYQAPNILSTLELSAMDMEKREAGSEIHVISDHVKISPSRVYLKPGENAKFRGLFGTESYEFAWTRGTAKVEEGILIYTAPARTGIHYITVFDSAGNSARAEAVVSGGATRKRITQTRVYTITAPDIYPDSEAQPMAVGNIQQGGATFSLAIDFPNYRDDDDTPVPMNYYIAAHIPESQLLYFFDDQGNLLPMDALKPCALRASEMTYTSLSRFDICMPDTPLAVEMYALAVASSDDPHGNLAFEPGARFELWQYPFEIGVCP